MGRGSTYFWPFVGVLFPAVLEFNLVRPAAAAAFLWSSLLEVVGATLGLPEDSVGRVDRRGGFATAKHLLDLCSRQEYYSLLFLAWFILLPAVLVMSDMTSPSAR